MIDIGSKKVFSIAIYVSMAVYGLFYFDSAELFMLLLGLIIPMLMIWMPEEINNFTFGTSGEGGYIDRGTPPWLIEIFGWIVLFVSSALVIML